MYTRHKAGNATTTTALVLAIIGLVFGIFAFNRSGQDVEAIVKETTNPLQGRIDDLNVQLTALSSEAADDGVSAQLTKLEEQLGEVSSTATSAFQAELDTQLTTLRAELEASFSGQVEGLELDFAKARTDASITRLQLQDADADALQAQLAQVQSRLAAYYQGAEAASSWGVIESAFTTLSEALQGNDTAAISQAFQQLSNTLQ